jgi:hypothetical protein
MLVHGVVADVVGEAVAHRLSPRVFSYRRGVAWLSPVSELAAWLREEQRRHTDPRRRGVYVLRRDVDSYTDSIPLGDRSPLWPLLSRDLGAPLPALVAQAIRVEMRLPDGGLASRHRGLPMGQPIASVIANLYLGELDQALERIPGAFYARYGDDFVFAHPDPDVARHADATIDRILRRLELTASDKKRQTLFLTAAGRPSERWAAAKGATSVPFLGTTVAADGTVGLDGRKLRSLLRDVERRTQATARSLRGADTERRGRAVCAVVNRALDPRGTLGQQRSAILLRRVVTDRRQLAQLDYWIARAVVAAVTGDEGVRAFRSIPYRTLRGDWGLTSLVAARNATRRR